MKNLFKRLAWILLLALPGCGTSYIPPGPYNFTNASSATNPGALIGGVSQASGGAFGLYLIVAFAIIVFVSLKPWGTGNALRASMFISAMVSVLAWAAGWISDAYAILFVVVAIMALGFSFITDR
jgi:hypothetical protein